MSKHNVLERKFACPECGLVMTAYKKASRNTSTGHLKKMWCVRCKKELNFTQLSKWA